MKSLYISKDKQLAVTPDSAIINRGRPWFLPEDVTEWRGATLIGVCINRVGMHISKKFAHRYYNGFIAAVHPSSKNDLACMSWCRDGALVTGPGEIESTVQGKLTITANGATEEIDAEALRDRIDDTISYVSSYITLKTGDMLLVDTTLPEIAISEGLDFDVNINDVHMLRFKAR